MCWSYLTLALRMRPSPEHGEVPITETGDGRRPFPTGETHPAESESKPNRLDWLQQITISSRLQSWSNYLVLETNT